MKRRAFLRRTGLTLAALGASEIGLSALGSRYYQVLADPTPRKLALLVGINQYRNAALNGCVTDVELQRELLIYRFGFKPSQILTLTDQEATRSAIEAAFVDHLVEQARPGDVVVFHFSGYGGRVSLGSAPDTWQNSLVTIDDSRSDLDTLVVQDVLEETLLLLLRSLATDKVTTVLDTSYTYPGKPLQGNLRIRARPYPLPVQPSEAELAFQEWLLSRSSLDRERIAVQRRSGQMPGILLTAAGKEQLATETRWNGFSAGLFTYALTQQLWQATPTTTLRISLGRVREQVEHLVSEEQQPQLGGQKSQEQRLLPYHLTVGPELGADGVITAVEEGGKTVRLWLAGLSPLLLEQYGANSLLSIESQQSQPTTEAGPARYVQILMREGLSAKAKPCCLDSTSDAAVSPTWVQPGQFVREWVRVLPRNIGLTVALDSSLERIERVDAISAFSAVPRISAAIAGEQAADYLFSKIQMTAQTQIAALASAPLAGILTASGAASPQSSYGLFSLGQDTIPNTIGEGGEAIKVAVRRLIPRLQTLLAIKLLSLTVNDSTSRLPVRAALAVLETQERTLLSRDTLALTQGGSDRSAASAPGPNGLPTLSTGSRIQYRLENHSPHPLYFLLLGLDSGGNFVTLYSPPLPSSELSEKSPRALPEAIAPQETLTLPPESSAFQWVLGSPTGLAETYLICSRAPFSQTLETMGAGLRPTGDSANLYMLSNSLEVAQAVLQDLHQASDPAAQVAGASPDTFALDVQAWASFRFIYQII